MRKILLAAFTLFILVMILVKTFSDENVSSFNGFYLDTAISCRFISDENVQNIVTDILKEAEMNFSVYDENSSAFKINNGEAYSKDKYPQLHLLLSEYARAENLFGRGVTPFCGELTLLWNVTGDAPAVPDEDKIKLSVNKTYDSSCYDGTVPSGASLDFGSGAKGYVCDKIYEQTVGEGVVSEIIFSSGSSSLLWSENNREFKTSVIDPVGDSSIMLTTNNAFISTSGGYERFFETDGIRYSHIIDIDSGYPVETDIASVTVILPCESGNGFFSDILSTLVFIGGTDNARSYYEKCCDVFLECGILIISENGSVISYGEIDVISE